jgi:MFS family permease
MASYFPKGDMSEETLQIPSGLPADPNAASALPKKVVDAAAAFSNQVAGQVADAAQVAASQAAGKIAGVASQAASVVTEKAVSAVEQAKNFLAPKEEAETKFVSVESEADRIRRKNLYYVSASLGFVWMLFHFTVVYFFGIELKSTALVGIFLGFGNLVSLVLDVPVGRLQKFFYAKKLYLFGSGGISSLLEGFLDSGANLVLLLLAAVFYGFTKEVNDITTLSYILNNSDPSEYSSIISRNNIFNGAGSLFGLVSSGFVLALNPTAAVIILIVFICVLIGFVSTYFDNSERTIDFAAVTKLKVIVEKANIEKVKEYAVSYVSKADFALLAKTAKFVFIRPMAEKKSKFDLKEIVNETKKESLSIKKVISEPPLHFGVLWAAAVVLTFGFWDTFAASFLIEYLAKLSSPQLAYVMLAIIAIPAFVAQDFFIGLSKRIGILPVAVFGIALSGVSLLCISGASTAPIFIAFGIANSLGYAAGMGISQGAFLDLYNGFYAKKFNLSEIDSNASASPMKIIQNMGNVIGLCLGGLLLALFGFGGFFVVFGAMLLVGAGASVVYRKKIAG